MTRDTAAGLVTSTPAGHVRYTPRLVPERYFAGRRFEWRTPVLRALDYRFQVLCEDADEFRPRLQKPLDALRTSGAPATVYRIVDRGDRRARRYALYADSQRLHLTVDPWLVVSTLMWHVNTRAWSLTCSRRLTLHAAAVMTDDVVVLLPAPMGSGKTTTTAGLLRRGFSYLTDEAVAVDSALRLTAYPKPLTLCRDVTTLLGRADLPPRQADELVAHDELGDGPAVDGLRPSVIVFPHYQAQATTTRLEPIGPADALARLVASTFEFDRQPRRDLPVLAKLARTCAAFDLTIRELDEACDAVTALARTARDTPGRGSWHRIGRPDEGQVSP